MKDADSREEFKEYFTNEFSIDCPPKGLMGSGSLSVAFIPNISGEAQSGLPVGYTSLGTRWRNGFRALSVVSNPPPPDEISFDDESLAKLLSACQYRGVLWLRNIRLAMSGVGRTRVRFHVGFRIGFTKYSFLKGVGSVRAYFREAPREIAFGALARFKLGPLADLVGSRVLMGEWAPSAWMQIEYRVGNLGRYDIVYRGSEMPSQWSYCAGSLLCRHDMSSLDSNAVSGFMKAGSCADAPARSICEVEALNELDECK